MHVITEDRIAELVVASSGASVSLASLRAAGGNLDQAGYKSVHLLTLLENLERQLGLVIDPNEDPAFLDSTASILAYALQQLVVAS